MPRRIVKRKWRGAAGRPIPPGLLQWLLYGESPGRDDLGFSEYIKARYLEDDSAWREHRDALLAQWIEEHPGTRPYAWWGDDPRLAKALRRKVRGSGELSNETRGECLPTFMDCDPNDPPCIESEASFLKRLGLLVDGEEKRVPRAAWKPERLDVDADGWAPAQA